MEVNDSNILIVKRHTENLLKLISQYKYLVDSYIIEYFVEDHWGKLPPKWQSSLEAIEPYDFSEELFNVACERYSRMWPLSLLAFKACCMHLALPRKYDTDQDAGEFHEHNPSQSQLLNHIFRKHVNPKKQHEIRKLSQFILKVAQQSKSTGILDVGCGQGHLSRLLALGHNFPTTGIEADEKKIERAEAFDKECTDRLKAVRAGTQGPPPSYVVRFISKYIPCPDFNSILSGKGEQPILLTGLHACGDLSATMIDSFVNCTRFKALVSVACCHMKLSDGHAGKSSAEWPGYPMSKHISSLSTSQLSYKSKEMACHANEKYGQVMREDSVPLKIHSYRAILEFIIRKYHPHLARTSVRTVKKAYTNSFTEYARLAYLKLSLPEEHHKETMKVEADQVAKMLSQWKMVAVFYALCVMLAPLVETVILLDRALYLHENGVNSLLKCLFDPAISPRCFAIAAVKSDQAGDG